MESNPTVMSRRLIIIWLVFVFTLFFITAYYCFHKNNPVLLIASEITIPVLFALTVWIIDRILRPYKTMSRSVNMLREGDFSSTLVKTGNGDVDSLIEVYNSMISQLREERLSIREKNHFLDLLIDSSPMGIIVLDLDEKIMDLNRAATRYLGNTGGKFKGMHLSMVESHLAKAICNAEYEKKQSVALADGRKYLCVRLFFMDHGFRHPFYIIEELTDEIRKAEKEAYGKIIRMMAHEVNNTIGPVNSIMTSVVSSPSSFIDNDREEIISVLNVAIQRNYQMNRFMQGFSNVVKLPAPEKERMELNSSLKVVADSFLPVLKTKNANLVFSPDPSNPVIIADRSQMEQVFTNIIKNAVEAIGENGSVWIATTLKPLAITFEDDGQGIDPDVSDKLFTPFFSGKPGGQGIGLTLSQEILRNHGFAFTLTNRKEGGVIFTIFPGTRN